MQTLLTLLVPLILVAGGYCWFVAVQRLRRGRPLLDYEPRRPVPWDALDLFFTLMIATAAQTAALLLVRKLLDLPDDADLEQLDMEARASLIMAGALATLATMFLSALAIVLRTGAGLRDLGLMSSRLASDIKLGLAAFVMLAPPVYVIQVVLVQWFESKHPLIELLREDPRVEFLLVSGFAAVVAAPIVEEYLFRMLLQGWMEKVALFRGKAGWISTWRDYQRPWPKEASKNAEAAPGDVARDEVASGAEVTSSNKAAAPDEAAVPDGAAAPDETVVPERQASAANGVNPYQPPRENEEEAGQTASGTDGGSSASRGGPRGRYALLPILISSAVFALLHWQHGPDWVPLFVLALGLGYLYSRTHRLVPCITVHFLLNTTSMLALVSELWDAAP